MDNLNINKILSQFIGQDVINNVLMDYLLKPKLYYMVKFRECMRELRGIINFTNVGILQTYMHYYYIINTLDKLLKYTKMENPWGYEDVKLRLKTNYDIEPVKLQFRHQHYDLDKKRLYTTSIDIELNTLKLSNCVFYRENEPLHDFIYKDLKNNYGKEDIKYISGKNQYIHGNSEIVPATPSYYLKCRHMLKMHNHIEGVIDFFKMEHVF